MSEPRIIDCREWITRLRSAAERLPDPVAFMEVCGTHTVNACRSGLHSLMPHNVRLISGPGCPVCVTSQGDIDQLVDLATQENCTICTYGDMLRVPGRRGSLEVARSSGADVRVIYSALDAVRCAAQRRDRQVIFAAVGFETTAPATAAAIMEAESLGLTNFTVLVSHKLILPAMRALLDAGMTRINGFLCPGHVAVIIGADAFREIVEDYRLPCVVAGFEDCHIAMGLARLAELAAQRSVVLENRYPQAVSPEGNLMAQKMIRKVFQPANVVWRALGELPGSGLELRPRYALFDARVRYDLRQEESPDPPGCRCAEVITGRCEPGECKLLGRACTPIYPVGPCMVSSEGACQAYFKYRRVAAEAQEVLS